MVFLPSVFRGTSGAETVSDADKDHVYPTHMLDNAPTLREIVLTWTMCFNDVLDAEKLYAALSQLLEIGDWRKLGGRLRLKVSLKSKILIQKKGSNFRPPTGWDAPDIRSFHFHSRASGCEIHKTGH
jgi:hypothetical protein